MLTTVQRQKFNTNLRAYKKKYLVKKHSQLDESGTRMMINNFLCDVLGYEEMEEVKTEYAIKGKYADYVLEFNKKQHVVVEVKAIKINLTEEHIRQAIDYANHEGIDWVLLTNGRQFMLFRILNTKKTTTELIFSYNLNESMDFKLSLISFEYLTKKCVVNGDLERFWRRFKASEPNNLCKFLYNSDVIKLLKRNLKKQSNINFSDRDIFDSIHEIVTTKIEIKKPKMKI